MGSAENIQLNITFEKTADKEKIGQYGENRTVLRLPCEADIIIHYSFGMETVHVVCFDY